MKMICTTVLATMVTLTSFAWAQKPGAPLPPPPAPPLPVQMCPVLSPEYCAAVRAKTPDYVCPMAPCPTQVDPAPQSPPPTKP